jgi:hypothetical protein
MMLHGLLSSPPPSTAWVLDREMIAGLRRDRRGQLHLAAEPVPDGAVQIGPVGLQTVDRDALTAAVATASERLEGGGRVAMVVPTGWIRMHLLTFDELPRRPAELREVVLWRLKKLLPVNPAELRVAPAVQPGDGRRDVLCLSMLERAAASIEAAFANAGVEVGYLGPRALALATGAGPTDTAPRLIVQQEPGFLSLVLTDHGAVRLVRTKPTAAGGDAWDAVERELRLVRDYMATELGVRDGYGVEVVADDPSQADQLRSWWAARSGVQVVPGWRPDDTMPPGLGQRIGASRLAPGRSLIEGRAA